MSTSSPSSVVTEMIDDAAEFLDGHVDDLLTFLDDVAALGAASAPEPGPELARLLAGSSAPRQVRSALRPVVSRPVRVRSRVAGFAAAAVAGLSLTGAAAVANELPATMQRAVAHFSETYLPFAFPRPVGDPPAGGVPAQRSPNTVDEAPTTTGHTGSGWSGPQDGPGQESGGIAARSGRGPTPAPDPRHASGHVADHASGHVATGTEAATPDRTAHQPTTGPNVPPKGSSDSNGSVVDPGAGTAVDPDPVTDPQGSEHAGDETPGKGAQGKPDVPPGRDAGAGPAAELVAPGAPTNDSSADTGKSVGTGQGTGKGTGKGTEQDSTLKPGNHGQGRPQTSSGGRAATDGATPDPG